MLDNICREHDIQTKYQYCASSEFFVGWSIISLADLISRSAGPLLISPDNRKLLAADQNICFLSNAALFPTFPTGSDSIPHCQHQGRVKTVIGLGSKMLNSENYLLRYSGAATTILSVIDKWPTGV